MRGNLDKCQLPCLFFEEVFVKKPVGGVLRFVLAAMAATYHATGSSQLPVADTGEGMLSLAKEKNRKQKESLPHGLRRSAVAKESLPSEPREPAVLGSGTPIPGSRFSDEASVSGFHQRSVNTPQTKSGYYGCNLYLLLSTLIESYCSSRGVHTKFPNFCPLHRY